MKSCTKLTKRNYVQLKKTFNTVDKAFEVHKDYDRLLKNSQKILDYSGKAEEFFDTLSKDSDGDDGDDGDGDDDDDDELTKAIKASPSYEIYSPDLIEKNIGAFYVYRDKYSTQKAVSLVETTYKADDAVINALNKSYKNAEINTAPLDVYVKGGNSLFDKLNAFDYNDIQKFISFTANANLAFFDSLLAHDDQIEVGIKFVNKYKENGVILVGNFWSMNIDGISDALNLKNSKTICFAFNKEMTNCYVAGSNIRQKNISIEDVEISDGKYAQYYRNLLNDDKLEPLLKAIQSTSENAYLCNTNSDYVDIVNPTKKYTGYLFNPRSENQKYITDEVYEQYSFKKDWQVVNCSEVWAARKALFKNEEFDNLYYYSINAKSGFNIAFCDNCEHTFHNREFKDIKEDFYE